MSGILLTFDPVLVRVGPVSVRWFGVFLVLAILAGALLSLRRGRARGLPFESMLDVLAVCLPVGLVGSRLFHLMDAWDYYLMVPEKALALGDGGYSLWGGLAFGGMAAVMVARVRGLPVAILADAVAPGLLLGQAVGRIGSFMNGDHQGLPTSLPWGTMYASSAAAVPDFGVPRHPTQVYEGLYDVLLLGLLLLVERRAPAHGLLFCLYLALYALGRFLISYLRLDPPFLLGLQQAQLASIVAFALAVGLAVRWWPRHGHARHSHLAAQL